METGLTVALLDYEKNVYSLRDEKGNIVGSGSREVCEVLLYVLRRCAERRLPESFPAELTTVHSNIHSAITI